MTQSSDLSHVFDDTDADSAQSSWQRAISPSLHLHLSKAISHHLGLTDEHPGKYNGTDIDQPEDLETPKDAENQVVIHSKEAISNVRDFGNPPNTTSPSKPMKPLPSVPKPPSAENL